MTDAKQELLDRTGHNLSLQTPTTPETGGRLDRIRHAAKAFAAVVINEGTLSRELSLALTDIESATQWAIGSVVRNQ